MNAPPKETLWRNLALALASTLVFGVLIEGAARLLEPPPVQREEYLWDWSERFSDGDFYTLEKGEGYPPDEETNVDGLRDVTRPVESREGLRRIVVLGDSVTFGHGLESAEAFPQLLNEQLEQTYVPAEVFNVALPGWSTRQERLAYERIARKYRPQEVILAVCLNDLAELQINLTKPSPFLLSLFKHSATARLAMGASRREIGAVEDLFNEPDAPRVNQAFALFFDEVRALRDEVTRDGAQLHVILFPFRFQVEPGAPPPTVQERIAKFGSTDNVKVLDFLPELMEEKDPASLFLDYDHFNREGHRKIAEWIGGMRGDLIPFWFWEGLSPQGRDELLAEAIENLQDPDELGLRLVRERAETLLARPDEVGQILAAVIRAAVDEPSPRVRFEAARTVYALGLPGEASLPALIRGVQHADPRVRAFATWTLGEMSESAQAALPALVALARQDGGAGRTGALTAIGKIGGDSPDLIPLLLDELKHPKENRRYRAARTTGRMGPSAAAAVPGLIDALSDSSALVRLHVVRALGNVGEAGKAAVPALIQVLNHDPDPEVRKEVSLTLSKLPGR